MAPPQDKAPRTGFFTSTPRILYAVTFGLILALSIAELGLVSQQLQNGGNQVSHYPTKEYFHDLGLILFTCIFTMVVSLGHYQLNLPMGAFAVLICAVFWGACAGILFFLTPFKVYTCNHAASSFPVAWQPFASQCSRVVALVGIAWALWGLCTLLLFGILFDSFSITVVKHEFYAKTADELALLNDSKA